MKTKAEAKKMTPRKMWRKRRRLRGEMEKEEEEEREDDYQIDVR